MIGTLAVDVTFGTPRRGLGGDAASQSPFHVLNVTAHSSTASVRYQLHIIKRLTLR